MEANLHFDLDNDDDRISYAIYAQAPAMLDALSDMQTTLRNIIKYDTLKDLKRPMEMAEHIQEAFTEILRERNVNLDI